MKTKTFAILLICILLLGGCGTTKVEKEVITKEPEVSAEIEEPSSLICYNISVGGKSVLFEAVDAISPAIATTDAELFHAADSVIVLWYNNTEVFVLDNANPPAANVLSIDGLTFATRDNTFDLHQFEELIRRSDEATEIIDVEPVTLDGGSEDTTYSTAFPDYDAEDVYSYAKAVLDDGTPIMVLQRQTEAGISYEYLGLDGYECSLSSTSQLIVEGTDIVIPLEFYINPNFKPL